MSSNLHLQVSLRRASASGDLSEVLRLVESESAEVNGRGKTGWSALHKAAEHGQAKVIRYLCRKGADVNCTGGLFDGTPLHHAVYWGQVRAVQQLLKAGADPHIQNANGDTSLAIAKDKNLETVIMLIENNTNCVATSPQKKENKPEFFPQKIKEDDISQENASDTGDTQVDEKSQSMILEESNFKEIQQADKDQAPDQQEAEEEENIGKRRPSMQIVRKPSNESAEMKENSVAKQPTPVPRSSCPTILPSQIVPSEKKDEPKRSASILEQSPFIKSKIEGLKAAERVRKEVSRESALEKNHVSNLIFQFSQKKAPYTPSQRKTLELRDSSEITSNSDASEHSSKIPDSEIPKQEVSGAMSDSKEDDGEMTMISPTEEALEDLLSIIPQLHKGSGDLRNLKFSEDFRPKWDYVAEIFVDLLDLHEDEAISGIIDSINSLRVGDTIGVLLQDITAAVARIQGIHQANFSSRPRAQVMFHTV